MTDRELLYTLALQRVPNIGDLLAKKMIQQCGSVEAVFKEKNANLLKIHRVGHYAIKELKEATYMKLAEAELNFIQKNQIAYWYFENDDYPKKLQHCPDGPILLFHKGNINLNQPKIISIVGTRNATSYGLDFCNQLLQELAVFNPIVVSGYAYGIDIAAHKACFQTNLQTIACLAHGFNQIYPKVHQKYVEQMLDNGGFVTDFWSNCKFDRTNFLKRNRIIAGLSEATIVIESAEKGGSLVTTDIASSYHREVFAVPGKVNDKKSQGCLNLIKTQQAHMITQAADIVYMLNWNVEELSKPVQKKLFVALTSEEEQIMNVLELSAEHLDDIALKSQLPTFKAASLLLNLELKGLVQPLPGKMFKAI